MQLLEKYSTCQKQVIIFVLEAYRKQHRCLDDCITAMNYMKFILYYKTL